jgi:hypothetical protein
MQNGITLRTGYGCDLDTLTTSTRIGKGLGPDICVNRWHDLFFLRYRKHLSLWLHIGLPTAPNLPSFSLMIWVSVMMGTSRVLTLQ